MRASRPAGLVQLMLALVFPAACISIDAAGPAPAVGPAATQPARADKPEDKPQPAQLPVLSGTADVPRPSGEPGNLKVLDWAGFKSALTYTIDDGQPSQVEHYADLQATGVRMTFFLNTTGTWIADFTSTFRQAVLDGHEIGNHTAHHCHADADGAVYNRGSRNERSACPGADAGTELDDCTAFITSTLGASRVWTSAAPFGDAGFRTAASQRFFLNRGVGDGTVAPNDETDPFALPIWGAAEDDGVGKFNAQINMAHAGGRWLIVLVHSIAPTTSRWCATVDISAIAGSIAHAKSLGDLWIDTMANIGAYWRGQKLVTTAKPTREGDAQKWTWTLPENFPIGRSLRVTVDGGTLSQKGKPLPWDGHGYYEVSLDAGELTLSL